MRPLLVSIPSIELNRMAPCGSVFDARRLKNGPFSHGLKCALQAVEDALAPQYSKVLCVARPEIFTQGATIAWLNERVEGAEDHLHLSNGQAMKVLPSFKNSVFVYGLDRQAGLEQFRALLRRAPEFLGQFVGQINSEHFAALDTNGKPPKLQIALLKNAIPSPALCWHYPFYLNRHSLPDSSERMLKWGSSEPPALSAYQKLDIILCGEAALHDLNFCHALANAIVAASRNPQTGLLLLMPSLENAEEGILQRMHVLLDGILRGNQCIPRVRLDNVMLLTDLNEADLQDVAIPFDLVLHETSPMWQHTHAFYSQAHAVHLYSSRKTGAKSASQSVLEALLGRKPVMHPWTLKFLAKQGIE